MEKQLQANERLEGKERFIKEKDRQLNLSLNQM